MILRIILSVLAGMAYMAARTLFNPISTLIQAESAGQQLQNSDVAAVTTSLTFGSMGATSFLLTGLLLVVLAVIWFDPLRKLIKLMAVPCLVGLALLAPQDRAHAFADTTDKTEAYTILPNQSACSACLSP